MKASWRDAGIRMMARCGSIFQWLPSMAGIRSWNRLPGWQQFCHFTYGQTLPVLWSSPPSGSSRKSFVWPQSGYSTICLRPINGCTLTPAEAGLADTSISDLFPRPRRDHRLRLPGRLAHTPDPEEAGKGEGADGTLLDVPLDDEAELVEHRGDILLGKPSRFGKGSYQLRLGHRLLERGDLAGSGRRHAADLRCCAEASREACRRSGAKFFPRHCALRRRGVVLRRSRRLSARTSSTAT